MDASDFCESCDSQRQKTLQFENCKFGFGGVGATGEKLPSAWSKLGSTPGQGQCSSLGMNRDFEED